MRSAKALTVASTSPPSGQAGEARPLVVALAGNPNSGKTTIFNGLTGLRQHVANYPGVTVEKKTGRCNLPDGRWVEVIDLPGAYSLVSRSPDEQVAMEVLRGLRADTRPPDVVVVVVDASNLQRNLYLVSQLIEMGERLVVALNMTDIAQRRGLNVSADALERELGVPVVPLVGHRGRGLAELKSAISRSAVAPLPDFPLPDAMKEERLLVGGALAILDSEPSSESPGAPRRIVPPGAARPLDRYQAVAERLLIGDRAADLAPLAARPPVASLVDAALARLGSLGIDPMQADIEAHYRWIEGVSDRVTASGAAPDAPFAPPADPGAIAIPALSTDRRGADTLTQKVDAVLIHKVWGLAIFALVMAGLFVSIFWLAAPIMDAITGGIEALGAWVTARMSDGPLKALITDGIFAGVGSVVVFVPQIAMLFLFLAILEDSGYLARAAFLMDRLLSKVGLHGKSFIPLLSSFACAIPGIMATRTIESRKDRLATIFVAPFMSCSARLPVYTLLIGAFFAGYGAIAKGGIMLACYALGVLAAVGTAWIFKRTFLKGSPQAFILELPTYKFPQPTQVARVVWSNTSKFLTRAGTLIFCLSVILWAITYYPHRTPAQIEQTRAAASAASAAEPPEAQARAIDRAVSAAQGEYSIAGRFGHFIEPAIRPLGYDWKIGVGLVGAFAAREVFVSTMSIIDAAGSEDDPADLQTRIAADYSPLVAVSLLVWFVLAMQCMSTLAIVRRETGGWRWPIAMLLYMNALAYLSALLIYQIGGLVIGRA